METYAIFNESFFKQKSYWMPNKLYRVVCLRANPRSKEYMLSLLTEKFPEAKLTTTYTSVLDSSKVILLYPDSVGLGWRNIEAKILKINKNITVLNGRKRTFALTRNLRLKLLFKRFLELTMLLEICFAPVLLFVGAILACKDKIGCRS